MTDTAKEVVEGLQHIVSETAWHEDDDFTQIANNAISLITALQSRVEALEKFPRQFMPLSDETVEDIASRATSKSMAVILTFNILNRALAEAPQEAP